MTARVGVPVPVLYGGIAALIALLMAVGFFAGRASTGSGASRVPETAAGSSAAPPDAVSPEDPRPQGPAAIPAPEAGAPPAGAPPAADARVAAPETPAAAVAAPMPAPPASLQRDVAEYFQRMDAAQSAAKTWSDPTALAQEVLAQAMRGDSSGFDRLIAASAAARDGVRDMDVPAPCAEHHRLSMALLGEAVAILTRLRDGVAAGDTGAVAAIAASSGDMETRVRAVDALGARLRAQYGVAGAR